MAHVLADRCVCGTGCVCGYQALAQHVYQTKQAYVGVMLCLLRQGKVNCALEMGRIKNLLNEETLLYLLRTSPSVKLVHELLFLRDVDQSEKRSLLPVGVALNLLLDINHHETVVDWLCDALDSGKFRPSKTLACECMCVECLYGVKRECVCVGAKSVCVCVFPGAL